MYAHRCLLVRAASSAVALQPVAQACRLQATAAVIDACDAKYLRERLMSAYYVAAPNEKLCDVDRQEVLEPGGVL